MLKKSSTLLYTFIVFLTLAGCVEKKQMEIENKQLSSQPHVSSHRTSPSPAKTNYSTDVNSVEVVKNPGSIPVLINKQNRLPDDYEPADLIMPNIPFIDDQKEKRKMRKQAAAAIEKLFTGASHQGIGLIGVSAYRSFDYQSNLFQYYVNKDGYDSAMTYSALPGTSEHETGLAIDVTGSDGKCAAEDCFEGSKEAKWLQDHAAEYGFIIRYPKGKTSITGYKYEPWHLRYVGKTIAQQIMDQGITLEEYYNAIPVNN